MDVLNANLISIGGADCRVPDYEVRKAPDTRLDLDCANLVRQGATLSRRNKPTTVRVILNKVEPVSDAIIKPGNDYSLGPPEEVCLIDGDRLEVFTWHCNKCSSPMVSGVRSEPDRDEFLTRVELAIPDVATPGVSRIAAGQGATPSKIWGAKLQPNLKVGGTLLSGLVRISQPFIRVRLWDVVRVAGRGGPDKELDWTHGPLDPTQKLHQQGQCYGTFRGQRAVKAGDRVVVAAPGCSLYSQVHTALTVDQKRAAFWVPIEVTLRKGAGPAPTTVHVSPQLPSEPFMNVFFPGAPVRKIRRANSTASPARVSHPFTDGMVVTMVFLGGATTAAFIDLQ